MIYSDICVRPLIALLNARPVKHWWMIWLNQVQPPHEPMNAFFISCTNSLCPFYALPGNSSGSGRRFLRPCSAVRMWWNWRIRRLGLQWASWLRVVVLRGPVMGFNGLLRSAIPCMHVHNVPFCFFLEKKKFLFRSLQVQIQPLVVFKLSKSKIKQKENWLNAKY